jgi:predicted S18 family serine protease
MTFFKQKSISLAEFFSFHSSIDGSQRMKRVHQSQNLVIFIFITVFVIGCVGAPTQEMSDARQAIKAARDVQADYYMPALWRKVEQNLAQAEQKLEAGEFKKARLFATLTKDQAVNAHNMAVAIGQAQRVWQTITIMALKVPNMRNLLEKANLSAHQGEVGKAIDFANQAYVQGQAVLNQAYLEQAKILIEQAKNRQKSLHPDELAIINLAQTAYQRQEGLKAYQLIEQLLKKLPKEE